MAHDFVIVIPVADRPEHLADCLNSLAALRGAYPYAGRVEVLVVDDSLAAGNRARHAEIAATHGAHHLDQDAQRDLVESLSPALRGHLAGVLGDGKDYARKGASITRNIAYLWLKRRQAGGRPRLFWFLDSDQEFRVNIASATGESLVYAIDYLNALDRIFTGTGTRVLTGKVVGDPPVSPAVMAGTLLDDLLAFLGELARLDPHAACAFHGTARTADDAAYHDMADLFGFKAGDATFRYRCPLPDAHDHAACLAGFLARLRGFFDGEHPTRRSYYRTEDGVAGLKPARTVYTGNYVIDEDALDWFVPFADLKLRMAGPTLGRILRAELGDAFVSANLPMLHRRTQGESGRSECRPGVEHGTGGVDLSGEFERQFYGDVMLFGVERLAEVGFPGKTFDPGRIAAVVADVDRDLRARYRRKLDDTRDRIDRVAEAFDMPAAWWQAGAAMEAARREMQRFILGMRRNFTLDGPAWRRIDSADARQARLAAIVSAIGRYAADRAAWRQALAEIAP